MLDPFSRTAIVGFSALCIGGAFAFAPIRARGSVAESVAAPARVAYGAVAAAPEAVRRDPFTEPAAIPPPASSNAALALPHPSAAVGPLPPNLSDDGIPAMPGTAAAGVRITAIVTGAHPYALIDAGGVHTIKGLGDRIGGVPIDAIDLDGIRLHDGTHLAVDPAARL